MEATNRTIKKDAETHVSGTIQMNYIANFYLEDLQECSVQQFAL